VLVLTAREAGAVSDEELRMLREVYGNLSFALTYLQKDTTVRFLSHFDPQTGLAKRSLFCERLGRHLSDAARRRASYAVTVIDIEQLSVINDCFGRRTGDLLLQHVADRLKRRFPQTENIAHFTGGTFALLADITAAGGADTAGSTMQDHAAALFGDVFLIEDRSIPVTVRVGLAVYPNDGKDANTLVQNAEAALHNTRTSGERRLHFSAKRSSEVVARLSLLHKLTLALEHQQFELHYQPKVNVVTRRLEGVEALIRWRDPESGLVAPAAFLPLLESSGLIVQVGQWVIQQAARDCQAWLRGGCPPVRIAVNISPLQLRHVDFTAGFLKQVESWSTEQWGLDVEITESALLDDSSAEIKKLKLLRASGVQIAIDDFGTGYSSLSRLSKLPIDTLKIDRSFVSPLAEDPSAQILVKTIISLARAFKMTTVAEGVETQAQLDLLWQMGCDQSQGYLHSRAVPADEFVVLLQQGKDSVILPGVHQLAASASARD
jgi:diguanylate cyclase (GGDEF)-like protein